MRPVDLCTPYPTFGILTRMMYGGRVSLFIAVAVVACTVILGATVGLIAGYYGKFVDMVLTRVGDIFMSIPPMLLAICIIAVLGTNFFNLIFTMTITSWVVAARMVRGQVFTCKNSDFIRAEVAMGAKGPRILFNQILPNTLTPLIVQETQHFGGVIMAESGMSFLGLGIPYPTPSWGTMIADGRAYLTSAPWVVMAPGLMLMITVLCFNFFGDGIRDVLDPKNKD
jgi:ABC-type dipeptide/oligopeptide/nickel transport system permease subunit